MELMFWWLPPRWSSRPWPDGAPSAGPPGQTLDGGRWPMRTASPRCPNTRRPCAGTAAGWAWPALAATTLMVSAVAAAARPVELTTIRPEQRNRDIMLCLDTSGSMSSADSAVVQVFAELAKEFDGERIGLTIFDSSAIQVFPLTDDYEYVQEQLKLAKDAFDGEPGSAGFLDGTWNGRGSSLIGDGLACASTVPGQRRRGSPARRPEQDTGTRTPQALAVHGPGNGQLPVRRSDLHPGTGGRPGEGARRARLRPEPRRLRLRPRPRPARRHAASSGRSQRRRLLLVGQPGGRGGHRARGAGNGSRRPCRVHPEPSSRTVRTCRWRWHSCPAWCWRARPGGSGHDPATGPALVADGFRSWPRPCCSWVGGWSGRPGRALLVTGPPRLAVPGRPGAAAPCGCAPAGRSRRQRPGGSVGRQRFLCGGHQQQHRGRRLWRPLAPAGRGTPGHHGHRR